MHSLILKTIMLGLLLGSGPALAQSDSSFGGLDTLPLLAESTPGPALAETDNDDSDVAHDWSPAFWSSLTVLAALVASWFWFDQYARARPQA